MQARLVAHRLNADDFNEPLSTDTLKPILFPKLGYLQHPDDLFNSQQAAQFIADAIEGTGKIVLATDYDTDGVTSAWVATRALIDYFGVDPNRVVHVISERKYGYGISEGVVSQILSISEPIDLVISADQGSSDEPRIKKLAEAGIKVCVTDHHQIAPEGVPQSAVCTVNPQQAGCHYDKQVAGCFVIFLVMTQTRNELIKRGRLTQDAPSLKHLIMNVAVGTVADSVSLKSVNNRAAVQAGLAIINAFQHPSWQAMHVLNDNQGLRLDAEYLGFQVATRINAASRVSDVTTAFHFLNADDFQEAQKHLDQLDQDNDRRKAQQEAMLEAAQEQANAIYTAGKYSMALSLKGNAGIQGIIATRIGEQFGLPTIAMTDLEDGRLAGSARGIVADVDLKEAFEWMHTKDTALFISRGGHKGAAGCMIPLEKFDDFSRLFEEAIQYQLGDEVPEPRVETDGELQSFQLTPSLIEEISLLEPFGREWPKPLFHGRFVIRQLKVVGQTQTHLSLKLVPCDQLNARPIQAIFFNAKPDAQSPNPAEQGEEVICVYQPSLNTFMKRTQLQLRIVTLQTDSEQAQFETVSA